MTNEIKEMIVIGSDHAGYKLKEEIKKYLEEQRYPYEDAGTYNEESVDYPDYAIKVIKALQEGFDKGILICSTGIGMSIAANKVSGIRASLCYTSEIAKQSREHLNANILVLGGKTLDEKIAKEIVETWLSTPFSDEEKHKRRVYKIKEIEQSR